MAGIHGFPAWVVQARRLISSVLINCDAAAVARMAVSAQKIMQDIVADTLHVQTGLYALLCVAYSFAEPACCS